MKVSQETVAATTAYRQPTRFFPLAGAVPGVRGVAPSCFPLCEMAVVSPESSRGHHTICVGALKALRINFPLEAGEIPHPTSSRDSTCHCE